MIKLALIRHCESVGNIAFHKSFFQEDDSMYTDEFMRTPSFEWVLSEYGRNHAAQIGDYLKEKMTPDSVFVSETRRTMETAELMRIPLNRLLITSSLRERDYAGLELKPKKDWLHCARNLNEAMRSLTWKPPGGESMEDVIHRAEDFLHNYFSGVRNVLIIAHGDIIQAMRMVLLGLDDFSRKKFREIRGNHVRTGQIYFYKDDQFGNHTETSVYLDGSKWHNLSIFPDYSI